MTLVLQVGLSSVDKQAMVEDWLNPDTPPYNQNQPTFRYLVPLIPGKNKNAVVYLA